MKKEHYYRVTVELISSGNEEKLNYPPLIFEARNHDNIFNIIEKMEKANWLDRNTFINLIVGLKLFSEVIIKHPKEILFSEIRSALVKFIKNLKTFHSVNS